MKLIQRLPPSEMKAYLDDLTQKENNFCLHCREERSRVFKVGKANICTECLSETLKKAAKEVLHSSGGET